MRARLGRIALIAWITCLTWIPVFASQEGTLPWTAFTIQTSDQDNWTNGVTITGTQSTTGVTSLKVTAFKRDFILTTAQIKQLRGFSANGLLVSFETGWKEFGGRTLYLTFQVGFGAGVQETLVIRLNEQGEVKIEKKKTS
jgi:hypothetical protein